MQSIETQQLVTLLVERDYKSRIIRSGEIMYTKTVEE